MSRSYRQAVQGVIFILSIIFATAAFAETVDISIESFSFMPQSLIIDTGTVMRWTNNDPVPHTSTSDLGVWDSGTISPGGVYQRTFSTAGVFPYHCNIHTSMVGTLTVAPLDQIYSIPEVYDDIDNLVSAGEIKVFGEFCSEQDPRLVTQYYRRMQGQPMDEGTMMFLDGSLPDTAYWYGGAMIVSGTVSKNATENALSDSAYAIFTATSYEYIDTGGDTISTPPLDFPAPPGPFDKVGCDSCKFAFLLSGGIDSAQNAPYFWQDLLNTYKYKVDPSDSGGQYCPDNVYMVYFDGKSDSSTAISDANVHPANSDTIKTIFNEISHKIAECGRQHKKNTFQKMISNHGAPGGFIGLMGKDPDGQATSMFPESLRVAIQQLIDSSLDVMYDELTLCHGGDIIDTLKNLDLKDSTEVHENSAADHGDSYFGPTGSEYLKAKLARLRAGDPYETAVDSAKAAYARYLQKLKADAISRRDKRQAIADTTTNARKKAKLQDDIQKIADEIAKLAAAIAEGSRSYVSFPFKNQGEWKHALVPAGGQTDLKFGAGLGHGHVTVWNEEPDGSRTRIKIFNWNVPGTAGFTPGNEDRVILGSGIQALSLWIESDDNSPFNVMAESFPSQTSPEALSNPADYAGFSVGGHDSSFAEFNPALTGPIEIFGIDEEGFNTSAQPAFFSPDFTGGCTDLTVHFTVTPNEYWNDVQIKLEALDLASPGPIAVECPGAEFPLGTITLTEPGEYTLKLGAIPPSAPGTISIHVPEGGAQFSLDSWGLGPIAPAYVCGDPSGDESVNLVDILYLISYLYDDPAGPAPEPLESGDVNADGLVNLLDILYLIEHLYGSPQGPAPICP